MKRKHLEQNRMVEVHQVVKITVIRLQMLMDQLILVRMIYLSESLIQALAIYKSSAIFISILGVIK